MPDDTQDRATDAPRLSGAGAFFGRRQGKPLRARQAEALATTLPRLAVDLAHPAPPDLAALFAVPVERVWLSIGFGSGEHLLAESARQPATGFIGAEPFINGMATFVAAFDKAPRPNVRLHHEDAIHLLDWLPPSTLAGIDLLYPDPWPKKRHWKRRFVSQANLTRFARVLRPGGLFRFASDIEHYVDWTLIECACHGAFRFTARSAEDWRKPYEGWPGTRYEAWALTEGRVPAYLEFERGAD